jgi:hypothetical protein
VSDSVHDIGETGKSSKDDVLVLYSIPFSHVLLKDALKIFSVQHIPNVLRKKFSKPECIPF